MFFDEEVDVCPNDGAALESSDALVGTVVDGKYRVEAIVGRGGMGAVYRATQLALRRDVALKVILGVAPPGSSLAQRFEREALAVARLKHPHVVAVYDFGVAPAVGMYVIMEFLEGHSLRHELRRGGRLPLRRALKWFSQVCAGVHAAHAAGVVHRDLKPDNIFLETTSEGLSAKVLDFGIAKIREASSAGLPELTGSGSIIGTAVYMSPEQCQGQRTGPATDVYSLGCVLYEMLTGRPPFVGESGPAIMYQHVTKAPVPPSRFEPSIPPDVDATILRALAKRPDARFRSVADLRRAVPELEQTTETIDFSLADPDETRIAPPEPIPNNIPQEVTRFVGRASAIADVAARLGADRIVTLTGAGGMGKTRLAGRVAARVLEGFHDGVWVVELAALVDASRVDQAVASTLGIHEEPGRSIAETLCRFVGHKTLLLVLDNCEHVVEAAAALVDALVRACPNLRVLATSREPLDIAGETVWQLPPLSLPAPGAATPVSKLTEFEAIGLFVDRAKMSKSSFALTEHVAPLAVELCRRLDGIPLAIELAAARVKALSVGQILAKLSEGFRVLSGGGRTSLPRHQTLRATIDWSYDLLSDEERLLLVRLSVFAGGWTLEAAEGICSGDGVDAQSVFDLLAHLVDKSLIGAEERGLDMRYVLPETIRQYSVRKLVAAGDADRMFAAHRAWFLEYAEDAFGDFGGPDHERWRARMDADHDNFLAALEWGQRTAVEPVVNLRFCVALGAYWDMYGYWTRGREWLERALAAGDAAPGPLRARALFRAGVLAHRQCDLPRAQATLEECLPLMRETGNTRAVAETLSQLGLIANSLCDPIRASALLLEALDLHRASSDPIFVAGALHELGVVARYAGDCERARLWSRESLAIFREIGFTQGIAFALCELARVARHQSDGAAARRAVEEALRVSHEGGFKLLVALATHLLASITFDEGDHERARHLYEEAITIARELGATDEVAQILEGFAKIHAARGDARRALALWGAATGLRDAARDRLAPLDQAEIEGHLASSRAELGAEAESSAVVYGRSLSLDHAVSLALGDDPESPAETVAAAS